MMPRHPPCALHSLSPPNPTKKQEPNNDPPQRTTQSMRQPINQHTPHNKQTKQAKQTKQPTPPARHTNPTGASTPTHTRRAVLDARVHYPDLKQQPHTTPHQPPGQAQAWPRRVPHETPANTADSSEPQQCAHRHPPHTWAATALLVRSSTSPSHTIHTRTHLVPDGCVLLRKEVIQPHLPVRLPCYDFVPIASPTFDHSLPTPKRWGWAVGFGCCRLS